MMSRPVWRNGQRISQIALQNARSMATRAYSTTKTSVPTFSSSSSSSPSSSLSSSQAVQGSASAPSAGQSRDGAYRASLGMTLYALAFTAIGAGTTLYFFTRGNSLGLLSDAETLNQFKPGSDQARQIEEFIQSHPLARQLRQNPELTESRPHLKLPYELRQYSLTGGSLIGPGKMVVPPFLWHDSKGTSITGIVYVGENLCGHKGFVHGGFTATMLDEGLARCCLKALPHQIAVTANLNINYRKPMPSDSYVVVKAETIKLEGRKAWVKGRLESLVKPGDKPVVYAEAEALFVSPKYAALMPKPS